MPTNYFINFSHNQSNVLSRFDAMYFTILAGFLTGCTSTANEIVSNQQRVVSNDDASVANSEASLVRTRHVSCTVDSRTCSLPYKLDSGDFAPVPLKDGVSITFDTSKDGLNDVLIAGRRVFAGCYKSIMVLQKKYQVVNFLRYTSTKSIERFFGSEVIACQTADEGWFFLFNKGMGYVGYAGPVELPLSLVGMRCS